MWQVIRECLKEKKVVFECCSYEQAQEWIWDNKKKEKNVWATYIIHKE